jgi:hypothetical protein
MHQTEMLAVVQLLKLVQQQLLQLLKKMLQTGMLVVPE